MIFKLVRTPRIQIIHRSVLLFPAFTGPSLWASAVTLEAVMPLPEDPRPALEASVLRFDGRLLWSVASIFPHSGYKLLDHGPAFRS